MIPNAAESVQALGREDLSETGKSFFSRHRRWIWLSLGVLVIACIWGVSQQAQSGLEIKRSDLGKDWPLTVDSGWINCESYGIATFTTQDGSVYALNGLAQGQGFPSIDPIWAANPYAGDFGEQPYINIGPLMDRALSICED